MDLTQLYNLQEKQLAPTPLKLKRYLDIDWEGRLNILTGMRGVGKSTMLLQYIKENYKGSDKALYISADNVLVNQFGLFDIALEFERNGGEFLAIDEVHKYESWNQELKNIHDSLPSLRVTASGSSNLEILEGQYDLSRRANPYHLRGLSFREYLFFQGFELPILSLEEVFSYKQSFSEEMGDESILRYFKEYMKSGYYPYFLEGQYLSKLNNSLSKVLYEDIPSIRKIERGSIRVLQKLIYLVATSSPFIPNITNLSNDLGVAKETIYEFIEYLEGANIFSTLYSSAKPRPRERKPKKIYLDNPNLYYAIESELKLSPRIGSIRESFAANQLKKDHFVANSVKTDFYVDEKYNIEVGGKSKDKSQIKGLEDAYVFKDGIERGYKNTVPLWLLGFLY